MDIKKLGMAVLFAVVISVIIVFQMNYTRGRVKPAPPAGGPAAPNGPTPAPAVAPPSAPAAGGILATPQTAPVVAAIPIPRTGWGRNPFLTVAEIAKLNEPPPEPVVPAPPKVEVPAAPVVVAVAPPPPPSPPPLPPPPPPLPNYVITAIVADNKGIWALVGRSKRIQIGDKLGTELVKDITPSAVVLEVGGKTRRIPLGVPSTGSEKFGLSSDGLLEDR